MKHLITIVLLFILGIPLLCQFIDASYLLGEDNMHSFEQLIDEMPLRVSGGVAAVDINNDGYSDLIYCLGDNQSFKLLINNSGESFNDRTSEFQLDNFNFKSSSPHFFNLNNDSFIDLIIGSVDGTPPKLFENIRGEKFKLLENSEFDILNGINTITISSTDFNNDGFSDLFFSHWLEDFELNHFWENLGNGHFLQVDSLLGFFSPFGTVDYSHTSNFTDLNNDGYDDLLLCSDFGTSQVWINNMGKKFVYNEEYSLYDENAMGSTLGDFDNDGDFDWFITSVHDDDGILEGNWGGTGNKLYVNDGAGNFEEKAAELGIDNASWGWGTTFADLNNDGYLDILVVNGWPQGSDQFKNDELKIFMSINSDYFIESALELNIHDTLQGRGVSVVDFDRDGFLDILTSNYRGPVKLFKNITNNGNHYFALSLYESNQNPFGIGAKVEVYTDGVKQVKELSNPSNYVSQNPLEMHFGLKSYTVIDSIVLYWNDNSVSKVYNIDADQHMHIEKPIEILSEKELDFLIYPNPTQFYISLVIDKLVQKEDKIYIYNSGGSIVKELKSFTTYKGETRFDNIDISEFAKGNYHITIVSKNISSIPFTKI